MNLQSFEKQIHSTLLLADKKRACFSTRFSCCCSLDFLANGVAILSVVELVSVVAVATGALSSASGVLRCIDSLCLLSEGTSTVLCKEHLVFALTFTISDSFSREDYACYISLNLPDRVESDQE